MLSNLVVLSAIVCFVQAFSAVSHPPRWFHYQNNEYYVDPTFKGNFFAATEYCRSNDMHLVTIDTQDELTAVHNFIKGLTGTTPAQYWTSGSRLGNDVDWVWLSNGKKIDIFSWGAGEPNNSGGTQKCLSFYVNYYSTGFYDDDTCTAKFYAICEVNAKVVFP